MIIENEDKKLLKMNCTLARRIIKEAEAAGTAASSACVPVPMTVEYGAPGEPRKLDYVTEGLCGFAWVNVSYKNSRNRLFINKLKKLNKCETPENREMLRGEPFTYSKSYSGGFDMWVSLMTQSVARKEAFAEAYAAVLESYGVSAYACSRLD